jgi:hypothetical protein
MASPSVLQIYDIFLTPAAVCLLGLQIFKLPYGVSRQETEMDHANGPREPPFARGVGSSTEECGRHKLLPEPDCPGGDVY